MIEAKIKIPGGSVSIDDDDIMIECAIIKRGDAPSLINAINTLLRWAAEASGETHAYLHGPDTGALQSGDAPLQPKPIATPEGSAPQLLALMKRLREDGETIVYVTPGPPQEWVDVAAQIAGEAWDWNGDYAAFGDFGRLYFHNAMNGEPNVEKPRKIVEAV